MSRQLRALDLFCKEGGATKGLQQVGFHVTGVDIHPQPRYCGDEFIQMDALLVHPKAIAKRFDFVWASPPCQGYSRLSRCRPGLSDTYPKLIGTIREKLKESGIPYVIENVPDSPLIDPIILCMAMFGKRAYRHRHFESSIRLQAPPHPKHVVKASGPGHWKPGTFISIAGHYAPASMAKEAMAIDWMSRQGLAEAIPPYFSEYIANQIILSITNR